MKKNLLLPKVLGVLTTLFLSHMLPARSVDPGIAAGVAKHFYQGTKKGRTLAENVSLSLVYPAVPQESDLLFIFNVNNNAGFVIVAADDDVTPILGYSDSGAFDPNDTPESLRKWLDGYEAQIFYVRENRLKADDKIRANWTELQNGVPALSETSGVGPLLQSTWNQGPNENLYTPGATPTGCVATAMAQLMYYWKFPAQGEGFHSYVENDYGALWADFGSSFYNWAIMPWHPNTPNQEISHLMYDCGIALDMNYSPIGSGASTQNVPAVLTRYFKYDPNTAVFKFREGNTDGQWIDLLKQELDALRPMQYRGTGSGGGHSFVCDGYDNNNLFHFNWGWGGSSDGFFNVNALNPGTLGAGGGTGGFNAGQGVVMGIQPDPSLKPDIRMSSVILASYVVSDATPLLFNANFINTGAQAFSGFVNVAAYDLMGNFVIKSSTPDVEYFNVDGAGAYILDNFDFSGLPPGTYSASLVYRTTNNAEWTKIPSGQYNNAVTFEMQSNSPLSIYEKPELSSATVMQGESFSLTTKLQKDVPGGVIIFKVSADLHALDGTWVRQLSELPSVAVVDGFPSEQIEFDVTGVNIAPGTYRIVIWAAPFNTINYMKVNVPNGFNAVTFLTVLPPPPPPDQYEPNNTQASAKLMPLNFAGNVALVSTFGSDHHNPQDEDYYKIVLPSDPAFHYSIAGRLQDAYNNTNGFAYTNDCFWRYHDGANWSGNFDDDMLTPGMNFLAPAGQTLTFFVKPYFAGTSGSYLLELAITKIPVLANDDPCNAISLPVNGIPQTGFSNVNATATPLEINLAPVPGSCLASWCNTETGVQVRHAMWFKFVAPANGAVEISTCGLADFDTQIAMFSVGDCNNSASYTLVAANDDGDGCSGYTSELTTGMAVGHTYYILVDGYEDATGNLGIKVTNLQASGVQNPEASGLLTVSPNPSSGLTHIKLGGGETIEQLQLSDLSGKLVSTLKTAGVETDLNLEGMANGLYLLQVRSGERMFTQKIMVQK